MKLKEAVVAKGGGDGRTEAEDKLMAGWTLEWARVLTVVLAK